MTQISSSAFNAAQPMCFARGPNGDLYGVNGLDRGLRWDGLTATVEQLGITAPANAPAVSSNSANPLFTLRQIDVIERGKGYVQEPAVTVAAPPSGPAARAKASVSNASVSGIAITDFGAPYLSPPAVTVAQPTGSVKGTGATLAVTMGSVITAVRIWRAGSGYTSEPTVTVTDAPGGAGQGAQLQAVLNSAGGISRIDVVNPGTAYTNPTISISGGGGSGAQASLVTVRGVAAVTVTNGGSGYAGRLRVSFSSFRTFDVSAVAEAFANTAGVIDRVVVKSPGQYWATPTASVDTPLQIETATAVARAVLAPGIEGRFLCAYRYVDDTPKSRGGPIASNLSPIATLDINSPASAINWSSLSAGAEPRVSRLELWRTTADQALVFYRVAVLPATDTSFTDAVRDDELSAAFRVRQCTAVASTDVITCSGHGLADGGEVLFSSLVGGAGLVADKTYYARDVTGTTFRVADTLGGAAVDITTDLTSGQARCRAFGALPIVLPDGGPNAYRFRPPPANKSTVVVYQDRAWYAVDSPGRRYDGTADSEAAEPNTLYFSEIDEPESVPETNSLILQDNVNGSDRITALMPFGGGMVVFQERNCYRLSYATEPLLDGSISLIAQRGCLHQRAYDVNEGVAYVADYAGIYVLDGTQVEPLSDGIDDFWVSGAIKFSAASNFHLRVDPRSRIVRFFYADAVATSGNLPDRALCYHPLTKAWWVEVYGQSVTAATAVRTGSQIALVAGGAGGAVFRLDSGGTDLLANGSTQGITASFRTGAMALNASKDRAIRVLYKPTAASATLSLRLHYNNSATPRTSAVASDPGGGFKTDASQPATLEMRSGRSDLGPANGVAICRYSGRVDDRSAGGDRHLALDVSVARPSGEAVTLYGIGITGVGEGS